MSAFFVRLCLVCLFICATDHAFGNEKQTLKERITAVQTAEHNGFKRKYVRALFDNAAREQIKDLATHPDDNIALQAAWELVRRTIRKDKELESGVHKVNKIDRRKLQRFLGFLEGRLRTPLPDWWDKRFARISSYNRDILFVPLRNGNLPYHTTEADLWAPNNLSAIWTKGRLVLSADRNVFRVPQKTIEIEGGQLAFTGVSALFTEDRCFVAFPNFSAAIYTLRCFGRKNEALLWSTDLFASYPHSPAVGSEHWATMVLHDDRLMVFGADDFSLYIESFSVATGKSLLTFNTSY